MVEIYDALFVEVIDKHAPTLTYKQHERYQKLTEETKALIQRRNVARKNGNPEYKYLRNKCVAAIRKERRATTSYSLKQSKQYLENI